MNNKLMLFLNISILEASILLFFCVEVLKYKMVKTNRKVLDLNFPSVYCTILI